MRLSVPCIQTELMDMAATAAGQWAATASSRDLLIGDCLWGSTGSSPPYITPFWNDDKNLDIVRLFGKPVPKLLEFLRLDMCAKVTSRSMSKGHLIYVTS